MPSRILDRHVGGNTTYARRIAQGLAELGHEVGRIPAMGNAPMTMVRETLEGLRKGLPNEVLHNVADTGLLVPGRRPTVVTVHGVASRWIQGVRSPANEAVWRFRVGRAIRSANHVITVSNSSALDIQEVFDVSPEKITVIPHGIDIAKFSTPTEISPELQASIPERFALYLGNIEPRKNLDALVQAFNDPEIAGLNVPLIIAGKPAWDFKKTMETIEASINVRHIGFVSDNDRTALMQRCSLFLFPSLYEGFGFPVLEALAAGAVVASSRRGSLKEVGGPALVLNELDTEGLIEGIREALTDENKRSECLERGRDWATGFSWKESVQAHVDVYESLLAA
ncbi:MULTISPECIES: glycosyltransferase family 4 protein [unclassified Pseudarthrobacter]|uniref:glycosyltransferase family 4 protein n=1 Tax=unclassified Pseudarthrobacter TaxID=2647000 RepID=UPI00307706E7